MKEHWMLFHPQNRVSVFWDYNNINDDNGNKDTNIFLSLASFCLWKKRPQNTFLTLTGEVR